MEEAIEEIGQQEKESPPDRCSPPIADDDAQTSEERGVGRKSLKPRLIFVTPMKEAVENIEQLSTQQQ